MWWAILMITVLAFSTALWSQCRRTAYWKRQAMANARARLTKDAACDAEMQQLNRKAGRAIAQLNAQVEDLTSELQRVRNINRSLLRQLDRREDPADE